MSWYAKQPGSAIRYYYRSRRVNGRAVKQYIGRGPAAALAARADEEKRAAATARRAALLAEKTLFQFADFRVKDSRALIDLLMSATLILAGYHLHHGIWRRRRTHAAECI